MIIIDVKSDQAENQQCCSEWLIALVFLCLLMTIVSTSVKSQETESVYAATASLFEARDLLVDRTDRSASLARRKAFDEVQRNAYAILLDKLTEANTTDLAQETPLIEIENLISGIDILGEQSSSRRYRARMTVRFDPESFTAHLSSLRIPHVLSAGPDIRIIERHKAGGRTMVWNPSTTQQEARQQLDLRNRIRRYGFHQPTLDDRVAYSPATLNLDRPDSFSGLGIVETAESVLFIDSEFTNSGALIMSYRLSREGPAVPLLIGARETPAETLTAGYLAVMDKIDTGWRSRLLVDTSLADEVTVELVALTLVDFHDVIARLQTIPLIKSLAINEISVPKSRLTLGYQGRLDQIQLALRYAGLTLRETNQSYTLSRAEQGVAQEGAVSDRQSK